MPLRYLQAMVGFWAESTRIIQNNCTKNTAEWRIY